VASKRRVDGHVGQVTLRAAGSFGSPRSANAPRLFYLGIPENGVLSCFERSTQRLSLNPALQGPV